jgi:putative ABC transport system permease protein
MRSPGFTVLAVAALALGIGANTVIFSIVNAVLLRPYPYSNPDSLVRVDGLDTSRNELEMRVSVPDFVDLGAQAKSFAGLAAVEPASFSLSLGDGPVRVQGARASAGLFTVLGVKASLGRLFLQGEDRPGAERTVILSHGLWERVFGADPKVVGRSVRLDGEPRTVVGVLAPNAEYPDTAEAWVPLVVDPAQAARDGRSLILLGRLAPEVTLEEASRQASDVAHRLAAAYPTTNEGYGLRAISLLESRVGRYRQILGILAAVVGFVLLLACANVANLLLQRAMAREREMVLRIVLGAGRLRLLRLMLLETAVLAVLGGALGLVVARWLAGVVVASIPFPLPPYVRFDLSPPVLGFALAMAFVVALLLGLVPAMRYVRKAGARTLSQVGVRSGSSVERRKLRNALVVTQVAVAFILLIGAALMLRSFQRLQSVSPGFDPRGRLLVEVPLPESKYPDAGRRAAFYQEALERLEAVPGVRAAAAVSHAPLRGSLLTGFEAEGQVRGPNDRPKMAGVRLVQGRYLETMGLPIQQGRGLLPSDTAETPGVAVISRRMASQTWPGENPIGKRFRLEDSDKTAWWVVVGITRDTLFALNRPPGNDIYISYRQWPEMPLQLVVDAGNGDPASVAGAVRGALREVDPDLAVDHVETLTQVVDATIWYQRLSARLLTIFAAFALVLAVVGIYGSMSYSVSQRTHEIGVRMALGAQVPDTLRMVVRDGVRVTVVGIGIGLFGAVILTGALRNLLYQIKAFDLASFLGVAAVLLGIAAAACYLPARRVARIDPLLALRGD